LSIQYTSTLLLIFLPLPPPPRSTLFPYTTLFRSSRTDRIGSQSNYAGRARQSRKDHHGSGDSYRNQPATRQGAGVQSGRRALGRSEEHTSELQSRGHLVCRLLLEKKKKKKKKIYQ